MAGFRVPGAVIDFAARLLPHIAPTLTPPHSVRRHRGELVLQHTADPDAAVVAAVRTALEAEGTIGLIVADAAVEAVRTALTTAGIAYGVLGEDAQAFDTRLDLVPATLAKGLEFDHVVLLEPAAHRGRRARRGDGAAPPLRLPHPRGDLAGRRAQRPTARRPRLLPTCQKPVEPGSTGL